MKVLTWNINGIRAVQRDKTQLKKLLDSLDADIICFQETKVTRDMLDEPTAIVENYDSYFGFSRKKTGYSGTANFCRVSCLPSKAEEGLTGRLSTQTDGNVGHYCDSSCFTSEDLDALDDEGRCVITQHTIRIPDGEVKEVAIINVYVPRAGDSEERLEYKLKFLTLLQLRAEALLKKGVHVVVLGDINTTHTNKDHCDPQSNEEYIRRSSRIWLNQFLQEGERDSTVPKTDGRFAEYACLVESTAEGGHFSDVFRRLYPDRENAFTNWCTLTGARQTNYGRRLDYILVDKQLAQFVKECEILADVHGSDHCPVVVTLDCSPVPSSSSPALSSKLMPEFRGQQKKLSAFFTKVSSSNSEVTLVETDYQTGATVNSKPKDNLKGGPSPLKKSLSSISKTTVKRQNSSKERTEGKKAKLQKEDSKQVSLNFFFQFQPAAKPNTSTSHKDSGPTGQLSNSSLKVCPADPIAPDTDNKCKRQDTFSHSSNLSMTGSVQGTNVASSKSEKNSSLVSEKSALKAWKNILGGLPAPPLCSGHKEPSVLRTVKKEGPNKNKQFYVCSKPDGAPGNPLSRCEFFQWLNAKKR